MPLPLGYIDKLAGVTGVEPASDDFGDRCIAVMLHAYSAPRRTRTFNLPVKSRLRCRYAIEAKPTRLPVDKRVVYLLSSFTIQLSNRRVSPMRLSCF